MRLLRWLNAVAEFSEAEETGVLEDCNGGFPVTAEVTVQK